MDGLQDELRFEIEALQATYDNHNVSVNVEHPDVCISIKLLPQGAGDEQHFVELVLEMRVPPEYPETMAKVTLAEARGLGDARQHMLLQQLHAETDGMAGHPVLGLLSETAKHFLTDNNHPEGDCAFCLLPMEPAAGAATATSSAHAAWRLPCFHAFHADCYLQWWVWRQRDLQAEEEQLRAHTGAAATAAIASEKLPPKEEGYEGLYTVGCPVCRTPSPLASMPHLALQLLHARDHQHVGHGTSDASNGAGGAGAQDAGIRGTAGSGQWAAQQAALRRVFEKQRAAGGIISTDTSYSISRLQQRVVHRSDDGASASAMASAAAEADADGVSGTATSVTDAGVGTSGVQSIAQYSHGHHRGRHRGGGGGRGGGGTGPSEQQPAAGSEQAQPRAHSQPQQHCRQRGQGQAGGVGQGQQPDQPLSSTAGGGAHEQVRHHHRQRNRPASARVGQAQSAEGKQQGVSAVGGHAQVVDAPAPHPSSSPAPPVALNPAPTTSSTGQQKKPPGSARGNKQHKGGSLQGGEATSGNGGNQHVAPGGREGKGAGQQGKGLRQPHVEGKTGGRAGRSAGARGPQPLAQLEVGAFCEGPS